VWYEPGARPANSRARRPVKGGGEVIVSKLDVRNTSQLKT
jgi:hypothetical protein